MRSLLPRARDEVKEAFTIRNDVNLKKASLRLVPDEGSPSRYHLEFIFDSSTECGITVLYAATESAAPSGNVSFTTLRPHGTLPKVYRGKGLGQTYRTAPEHALDLSKYEEAELSYTPGSTIFPIIVCLEAGGPSSETKSAVASQTTFAHINFAAAAERRLDVRPLKQKIQVDGASYELQEIFGIDGAMGGDSTGSSNHSSAANADAGVARECVICMTEPRDTTVLPCRHMCMCSECAKVLRMQSEKCPICRTPIEQLLQIKISSKQSGGGSAEAATAGGGNATAGGGNATAQQAEVAKSSEGPA